LSGNRGHVWQHRSGDHEEDSGVSGISRIVMIDLCIGKLDGRAQLVTLTATGPNYGLNEPPAVVLGKDHVLDVGHHDLPVEIHVHWRRSPQALDDAAAVLIIKEGLDSSVAVRVNEKVLGGNQGVGGVKGTVTIGVANWVRANSHDAFKITGCPEMGQL